MAESFSEFPSQLGPILDPLASAGSDRTRTADSPPVDGELSRPIRLEAASGADKYVISAEEQEQALRQLEEELDDATTSVERLNAALKEKDERKAHVLNELNRLREKIRDAGADSVVEKLMLLLRSVKALERQEFALKSNFDAKHAELEAEICELEAKASNDYDDKSLHDGLDHSIGTASENLHLAKKELAARLRAVLSLKRQLDDVPTPSELTQYKCRLAELNTNIGEKDRQTRKFYSTYNALLEIKELMLKEISLLNSINSQFQDAIASTAGQMKLIDSMEGILKGIKQKLEKMQVGLQADQKICDTLRERSNVQGMRDFGVKFCPKATMRLESKSSIRVVREIAPWKRSRW
ncbi:coiled-coil domain-containing protein 93 isoform X2 [Punica granatum]|uniref:Coiled-coil domain-containing protein 93 isoform X2 n=1 Tax=Punica granatum TaxID=22663 RepID=A0A6P8BX75_PUNGR|nr:coiled-coil domain-containing protein 93 isoform X2 [Punica granatum]